MGSRGSGYRNKEENKQLTLDEAISQLQEIGFDRWTKYEKDRLYINAKLVKKILNMKIEYYKTGNFKDVYVNGEHISNSRGGKILSNLVGGYYDIQNNSFYGLSDSSDEYVKEATKKIIDEVRKRIPKS